MNDDTELQLSEEDQFAADLEAAQDFLPENRRRKPEPPPDAAPASTPAPPAPASEAPIPAAAPTDAPAPTPAAELFPGFNALPEDTRKFIMGQREEAEAARRQAADLDRQYKRLHGQTAPLQSQHAKQVAELTRLQQELAKVRKTSGADAGKALRERIAAMKADFPDDAEVFEGVLNEAAAAREEAARVREELDGRLATIQNRMHFNDEIAAVAQAHPNWTQLKTAFDVPSQQFVPKVDTNEARELCVWANNLDHQEREIIHPRLYSNKASDVIYALNRFKHDKAWADSIRASQSGVQQQAPTAGTPAPSPRMATPPDIDPDPTRRASPPSSTTRNDTSTEEQELVAAAEIWRQRQKDKQRHRS